MKYIVLVLALLSSASRAKDSQEFQQELDKSCEKTMACAKAQLPPAMQGMAEQMMGGMCQAYDKAFNVVKDPRFQDIYSAAKQCVSSMTALSCADLMDDPQTPACQEYERVAAEYQKQ